MIKLSLGITLSLFMLSACNDESTEWSKDYDIEWPLTTITGVEPISAAPGSVVTVSGTNLHFTHIFYIGTLACEVIEKSETRLTIKVPAAATAPSSVSVYNVYRRTYVFEGSNFVPIIP